MFERYTEHARRVIFFARFEASRFGTPHITSEQILLGLLRGKALRCLGAWRNALKGNRQLDTENTPLTRSVRQT